MKIVSIVGNRPQFIKCASLSYKLGQSHKEIIVHTDQHYNANMCDIFFKELEIPEPDYNLEIGSATHGEQTSKMLIEIEKILIREEPETVLVYGDTNSTIARALAASKLHIPVVHVEAGLRSFDRTMSEEINRILTDHASNTLFCTTETAVRNLKNEGITEAVHNFGDVIVEALQYNIKIAEEKSKILEDLNLSPKDFMVATVHRVSNTDSIENLSSIVNAFCDAEDNIVFPVHPRTEKYLRQYGLWDKLCQHLKVISPIGYIDMLKLMSNSKKILTDSGVVQKEAYVPSVPCITMCENTEWVETVNDGWNVLVGAKYGKIIKAVERFKGATRKGTLFGKGNAASQISRLLRNNESLRFS